MVSIAPIPPTPPTDDPPLHDRLLKAFIDPDLQLTDLADQFHLTLAQLVAWVNAPQTQHDLAALTAAAQFRARTLAQLHLPAAVDNVLRAGNDLAAIQITEATPIAVRLRYAETSRRSAAALHRFAAAGAPSPSTPPTAPPPVPASEFPPPSSEFPISPWYPLNSQSGPTCPTQPPTPPPTIDSTISSSRLSPRNRSRSTAPS